MLFHKLPFTTTQKGWQITVPAAATSLFELIKSASGDQTFQFLTGANAVIMQAEDGDVRWLADGNIPEADKGVIISQDMMDDTPKACDLNKVQLISVGGGNVKVNIQVGEVSLNT
jgi:hypothetical protein